jgi:YidC/Oxa1 family membrane protein insertase
MAESSTRSKILDALLLVAALYLLVEFTLPYLFPQWFGKNAGQTGIALTPQSQSVSLGNAPTLRVENHSQTGVTLSSRCPLPPVDVFMPPAKRLMPKETAGPCPAEPALIPPGKTVTLNLAPWKYSVFGTGGTYQVKLPLTGTGQLTAQVTMKEPGPFTKLFRAVITKPFLNFLVFVASFLPDHNLGVAIIVLTLLVKLLLYLPTQHSLESQKKMQLLQPKIEAVKRKYPDDPQKVQEETMKLWKEHKINPLSSCLPVLVQFPVLIGLFYVIRDGSHLGASQHLLYSFYKDLPWKEFGTHFLGLDLLQTTPIIGALVLVALQFGQMKLAFTLSARKKKQKDGAASGAADEKAPVDPQTMQQRFMLYGLPLMIGFFAIRFPLAVALYWGVSTLFAIGQQIVVNRKTA